MLKLASLRRPTAPSAGTHGLENAKLAGYFDTVVVVYRLQLDGNTFGTRTEAYAVSDYREENDCVVINDDSNNRLCFCITRALSPTVARSYLRVIRYEFRDVHRLREFVEWLETRTDKCLVGLISNVMRFLAFKTRRVSI